MNDTDKTLYGLGLIFSGIALISFTILNISNISISQLALPCLFRLVTGFYCPGCGSTRAFFCLIHFKLLQAIYFNPGFVFSFIYISLYMITNTIQLLSKNHFKIGLKYKHRYLIIWVVLLLANCIIKNILLICFSIKTM